MGYNYLAREGQTLDSRSQSLKEQLLFLQFDASKRIKVFSLFVRVLISALLLLVIVADVLAGVYQLKHSVVLVVIVLSYASVVYYLLNKAISASKSEELHNFSDLIYVSLEIVCVYLAIVFFPTHPANMYSNSLKGFMFTLIVLSGFTGKWYYGLYSGGLVGLLNLTFLVFYEPVRVALLQHGLDFERMSPSLQVSVLSMYYFITGGLVSFPFYLLYKQQSLAINAKAENIIARPYFELSLPDGDLVIGEYVITKITTALDTIGADYVAVKTLNEGPNLFSMIIGDTVGHGVNRSPGAIIAMAAFKSSESQDPKHIQETINRVLFHIDKDSGGKTLCFSALFKKNGIVEFSGRIDHFSVMKNVGRKHKVETHVPHGEILGISDRLKYTRKSEIHLAYNDVMIFRTDGDLYNDDTDDKTLVMVTRRKKPK